VRVKHRRARAWTSIAAGGVGRQPASRMSPRSRRRRCRKAEFMTTSVPPKARASREQNRRLKRVSATGEATTA